MAFNGKSETHDDLAISVEVNGQISSPISYALKPAYPNPFNPVVVIPYHLSGGSHVEVRIYDLGGNLVRELYHGRQAQGSYTIRWDGRGRDGQAMPSGVYFIQVNAGTQKQVHKATLMR